MIQLEGITKTFNTNAVSFQALNNVSLSIKEGEFVAITGTSGSGKTTLLNILGCLDDPTSGKYSLTGEDVSQYNKTKKALLRNEMIGFVLQDFALVEHYTVKQNVMLPLMYVRGNKKKKERQQKIEELLSKLGIAHKEKERTALLSGGQKQRVAIGRALINEPRLILADEPTGALDQKTSKEIMEILNKLHKEGKTVIIVTHDPFVADYCDRIIQLEDGKVVSDTSKAV
ncbi:ABC transporter ATP-binding protein [Halalkalibacterium halodurans]|uniref:ABC transporter (ATP-binding protein) n=2 Tax=Halalkalibacterium halodurans TaxID=86665 RepID=Q9K767_HALH5|nr:ABC transporter ATP-binding protein [Halalkalibacterium halodurans]MDY7224029.1 ABC transporter ATP-binding protein [Halalkalibacterium halodurans]MDY7243314.1 ABC transporter ATP-binding protein [Halalkalibacterium halodurans]MED3646642.1 ABC transporter ATP-binding protein [Halalkalibacterium halodurans]TPE66984.1 ABC transporter ATP-binding protein [Halalkalibacterium halodurans]BAB07224.1 ABC transporter (ATP-binding protein) [Halalkalibacterium halodurans C-125]